MLKVSPLRDHQIDAAFPLIESALQRVTLSEWRRYADTVGGKPGRLSRRGIMVATAPNGVMRGAFDYAIESGRRNGRAAKWLLVRHLVVPLLGQEPTVATLAEKMQQIARQHGCCRCVVTLPPDMASTIEYFRTRGYEVTVTDSACRMKLPAD